MNPRNLSTCAGGGGFGALDPCGGACHVQVATCMPLSRQHCNSVDRSGHVARRGSCVDRQPLDSRRSECVSTGCKSLSAQKSSGEFLKSSSSSSDLEEVFDRFLPCRYPGLENTFRPRRAGGRCHRIFKVIIKRFQR